MAKSENSTAASKRPVRRGVVRRKTVSAPPAAPVESAQGLAAFQPGDRGFLQKYGTPFSILLGAAIIAAGIYFSKNPFSFSAADPASAPNRMEVSADDDPVLGAANAPVTIIEFSDFQCPYCRQFWRDTLPQIKTNYIDKGLAKLVYRDFPLTNIHPSAQVAAEAGECADSQGKFWQFHDAVFARQDEQGATTIAFTAEDVKSWGAEAGLSATTFNECIDSASNRAEVLKDFQDGVAAGVGGTPTFFVNGIAVEGALPYIQFQQLLDQELRRVE
ncbi:MAG: hypothetical protein A3K06_01995 [Candidatus Doudnabacteria bacterium RIFCSPHIGHO2_01_52_17]|uniref:Thioredoxin domain-containing protein n=1 Tax=Candidatus Doudnabacteria bacterium RIFCSPHIGHO2_01_52_17 TaxID=1817820 RepID=A0A1F5NEB4_9BACT|nr:MAG: hypothetical protein A3K06_01995 [Candidatus Doudnabacteria bacterium RIFCSPHIGHO2_01_52_17]